MWWRHHFDDVYFRLHEPLFQEAASRREAGAILELLGLPHPATILDVPCGWGRHANLLAEAGHDVVGADLSPGFVRRAWQAGRAGSAGDVEAPGPAAPRWPACYTAAELRFLPFTDDAFDGVVNVFTSLGLFLDDAEDIRALAEVRRVLRPAGRFLLESMHRDDVVAGYAERDAWELPDGTEVRVRRRFDPVTGISREVLKWRRGTEEGVKRHALRLRTATEIARLLDAAGLRPVAWHGDWDGSPFRRDSERLIVLAEPY